MITCKECGKQLNMIQTSHFKTKCTGRLANIAEYRREFPNEPLRSDEVKAKMGNSEASFMAKWGNTLGQEKWKAYCEKLSKKNTLQAFLAKGKTEQEWRDYNNSRAVTLKNMIARYGEFEGTAKFAEYRQKQKDAGNTLKFFTEKYGEEIGTLKYAHVCRTKGITLENMVRAHGEDEGFKRYHSWLEKTKGNYISLVASQFIKDLVDKLPTDFTFHEGVYGKEFCVWEERAFMFDFVVTHPVRKAIEFNGDYWHANPTKYNADSIVPLRGGHVSAQTIWDRDARKNELLIARGFKVLTIWESEYLNSPQETINRIAEWLTK